VIPARFGATRLPGKPLVEIAGRPLIQWVFDGCCGARLVDQVLVATDDARIAKTCRGFGAETVMTAADHPSGTDRVAEAAAGLDCDVIVNVQGDEALVRGDLVDAAVESLGQDPELPMATLAHPAGADALDDPNRVKVTLDRRGRALYFSRSRIPFPRNEGVEGLRWWQHVGLYAYRRDFLETFVGLEPSPLERCEGLEQLRALENGYPIGVAVVEGWESIPVDVPEDVARVEAALRKLGRLRPGAQ
jgi:3-deoxy-manno-octulosonate cytidylyltransferase (CMP-KDO synthetase)